MGGLHPKLMVLFLQCPQPNRLLCNVDMTIRTEHARYSGEKACNLTLMPLQLKVLLTSSCRSPQLLFVLLASPGFKSLSRRTRHWPVSWRCQQPMLPHLPNSFCLVSNPPTRVENPNLGASRNRIYTKQIYRRLHCQF